MPPGGDVTYSWPSTTAAKCGPAAGCSPALVDGLLACAQIEGGYWTGQGSSYIRVLGVQGGACQYEVAYEFDGGATEFMCSAPLPVHGWSGLDAVEVGGIVQDEGFIGGLNCTQVNLDGGGSLSCPAP
jgi:hypothetical protein